MSDRLTGTAEAMRREFDQSFRGAPAERDEVEDFLAIRVGGDPYAVRLSDVAGLHADRAVVPYPSRAPGALGLAAVRGVVAPVYDLRVLLGHQRSSGAPPRWLLLARAAEPVALAFEQLESYLRVSRRQVSSSAVEEHARRYVRGAVQSDFVRALIDVAAMLAAITSESTRSDDHV